MGFFSFKYSTKMDTDEDIHGTMHSFARKSLPVQEDSCLAQELPETPKPRPAKKSKTLASDENNNHPVANSVLLMVMERFEQMQEESLRQLRQQLKITQVPSKVSLMHSNSWRNKWRTWQAEKENIVLRDRCNNLDAYKRSWNLWVAGIHEQPGENVKKIIIDVFSQVSPDIANQLALSAVNRLGPRSGDARSSCRIIVQFLS